MPQIPSANPAIGTGQEDLISRLLKEKKIAREYQERRHEAFDEIYMLYRNKVQTNRLTQRQAVNIPLMKETIKTLLSKIDDVPEVDWKELGGDEYKELILQEIWNRYAEDKNFEGIDIQDKKTVLLYGRAFKKLNWTGQEVTCQALDVYDVVIDPLVDPLDIETARFLIHQNLFRTLREILADARYSTEGKDKLKTWAMSDSGMIQSSKNREEWEKKMERVKAMGVDSSDFPLFAAGDVIVNLTEHYTQIWNTKDKAFERRVVVYADDQTELLNETLEDLIGVDFYPFISWSEDIETSDFWSDGVADLVRVPNKLINIWFSQHVENRALQNFQMHWYDATVQGYVPQTYEPGPGRLLPAPGNPKDVIMPVEINGLEETMTSIDFIIKMVERGTSATAIEKGTAEKKQITLGEVETLVGKAMERTLMMAKFYRRSWKEFAMKWYRLLEANMQKSLTVYKVSSKGKIWPKTIVPADWKSPAGFMAFVRSSSEQEEDTTKAIQRFQFLLSQFPQNKALRAVAQKRMLKAVDLTPEELRQIEDEEKQNQLLLDQQMLLGLSGQSPRGQPSLPGQASSPSLPMTAPLSAPLTPQPQALT